MLFARAVPGGDPVVFDTPDDVEVQFAPTSAEVDEGRRLRGEAGSPHGDALTRALTAAGFTVAVDARIGAPSGRRLRGERTTRRVQVPVRSAESALVLVESTDGTFAWLWPDQLASGRATRSTEDKTLSFNLNVQIAQEGLAPSGRRVTRSPLGDLMDWLTKPIRTVVLKFTVRLAVDALMARIEGNNPTGLVRLLATDPKTWRPGTASLPPPPTGRAMRILLLVHGTFSSTAGGFGQFTTHAAGRFFVETAVQSYDAVIGFDHKTLAESVEANAELLADALGAAPQGAEIDAIAHSRGGLVLRVLFDELLAASRPDLRMRRAIFVGCTNAGTHLASPENWEALADLYTNIVMAGARVATLLAGVPLDPFIHIGIKTLGEFVQLLSQVAIGERRVPGLASMYPEGDTVRRLAGIQPRVPATVYSAITSNFAPRFEPSRGLTKELAQLLLDRVTNDLWEGDANDLVVDTASMTNFGAHSAWIEDARIYNFGNVETIYHTVYFTAPETCQRLLDWLELSSLPPELVVPRRTRIAPEPIDAPSTAPPRPKRTSLNDYIEEYGSFETPLDDAYSLGEDSPSIEIGAPGRARFTRHSPEPRPAPPPGTSSRTKTSIRKPAKSSASASPASPSPIPFHAAASMPQTASLTGGARLEVTLSREDIAQATDKTHAAAVIAASAQDDFDVIVTARLNCRIVGNARTSVPPPSAGTPEVLGFDICGAAAGPAEVWADVYQKNRRLARLVVQPTFVTDGDTVASASVSADEADLPVVELRILEEGDDARWRLRFLISSNELNIEDEYFSEWQTINKADYVASLYARLENSWADTAGEFETLMELVRADGTDLFRNLCPEPMQRRIWTYKDQIGSLQVYAQEPSIPWEIVYVAEPGRPLSPTKGKFLAELGLTRWIPNVGIAPATLRLRAGKSLYCIPEYVDPDLRLPMRAEEAAMLERLLGAQPAETGLGAVLALLRRSGDADYDHLHFACHGSANPARIWDSGLSLKGFMRNGEIAAEQLSVAAVRANADLAGQGSRPLIFLNACQSGVGGYSLSGAGGLAQAFVRGGAGLFVGTLWSVEDRTALTFSTVFYQELKAGKPLVQAARAAREAAKARNESTWLAYSIYGHPYARAQP